LIRSVMKQTFECKEPGCDKEVVYEDKKASIGFLTGMVEDSGEEAEVFLECEDGHAHKYRVRM